MTENTELPQFVNQRKDVVLTEVESWKEVLCIELKNRKVKMLHLFLEKLNAQEVRLLDDYDKHAKSYEERLKILCNQYSSHQNDHSYLSDSVNALKKQNKSKTAKSTKHGPVLFPEMRIHLSDINDCNENSLGQIEVSIEERKISSKGDKVDSMVYNKWTDTGRKSTYLGFAKDLQQFPGLKEEILEYKEEVVSKKINLNKKPEKRRQKKIRRKERKEKDVKVQHGNRRLASKLHGQLEGKSINLAKSFAQTLGNNDNPSGVKKRGNNKATKKSIPNSKKTSKATKLKTNSTSAQSSTTVPTDYDLDDYNVESFLSDLVDIGDFFDYDSYDNEYM